MDDFIVWPNVRRDDVGFSPPPPDSLLSFNTTISTVPVEREIEKKEKKRKKRRLLSLSVFQRFCVVNHGPGSFPSSTKEWMTKASGKNFQGRLWLWPFFLSFFPPGIHILPLLFRWSVTFFSSLSRWLKSRYINNSFRELPGRGHVSLAGFRRA